MSRINLTPIKVLTVCGVISLCTPVAFAKHVLHDAAKDKGTLTLSKVVKQKHAASAGTKSLPMSYGPEAYHLNDNDQTALTLSTSDINRLYVVGDKITGVNGPQDLYMAKNDPSGSVYLNVFGRVPFSLFVSTASGKHFSLFVLPKAVVGKTVSFTISGGRGAKHWENSSYYQTLLVSVIKGMMLGQGPSGYSILNLKRVKSLNIKDVYWLTPIRRYDGATLSGLVYRIENQLDRPITLSPNMFYRPNVRAAALSKQTIAANSAGLLYEVISNGGAQS